VSVPILFYRYSPARFATPLQSKIEPTDGTYATFSTGKLTLPAGVYSITLQGLNPNGGENTILVDSVKLDNVLVNNGNFEPPQIPDYQVAPASATWSFMGTAGVAHNGGFYTSDNPPAPGESKGSELTFLLKVIRVFELARASRKG
jgi:hypothetical protein